MGETEPWFTLHIGCFLFLNQKSFIFTQTSLRMPKNMPRILKNTRYQENKK